VSHGTVAECIKALEREIEGLRRVLEKRAETSGAKKSPDERPWKFRAG
jgi:hypothetical protein